MIEKAMRNTKKIEKKIKVVVLSSLLTWADTDMS